MQLLPTEVFFSFFFFSCVCGKEYLKDLCLVYNLKSVYHLGGAEWDHFGRGREDGRLGASGACLFTFR